MLIKEVSWKNFRDISSDLYRSHLFRGQTNSDWSLRTSYHRSIVSRLSWDRYFQEILFDVAQRLEDHAPQKFASLKKNYSPKLFWNYLSYLQHYGFPTPMLDWTASPYVAAYFAFKDSLSRENGSVAIYSLWNEGLLAFEFCQNKSEVNLEAIDPPIQISKCDYSGNSRSLSQQSYMMLCKDENVEQTITNIVYNTIRKNESDYDCCFAKYIISVSEAKKALRDLSAMNITGATIWDSIDGICEHLKIQAELVAAK